MDYLKQIAVKSAPKGNFKATILVKVPTNSKYEAGLKDASIEDLLLMVRLSKHVLDNVVVDENNSAYDIAVIMEEHRLELNACKAKGITHMI
jgi:hypothetical protein